MKIHYNPKLKQLARQLRKNSTVSEILLWQRLRNKKFKGYDFHRQKPISEYIVDFFCPKLNLIIEVDGITHDDNYKFKKDKQRQTNLEALGFHIIRFWDDDIKKNIDAVLQIIEGWVDRHTPCPS
ncbi:MAG TPA: DUF559 domain-containing protein [Planctomycetota bacterium]|nr:DUF559 domain-containing protein [Planctomycetota bacterium]